MGALPFKKKLSYLKCLLNYYFRTIFKKYVIENDFFSQWHKFSRLPYQS